MVCVGVSCCQNVQQDEGREVTIGFNDSEVFGDHGNANFSAVVGQEVTLRVKRRRPGMQRAVSRKTLCLFSFLVKRRGT